MLNSSPPVYEQIAEIIRRQIHDGDYLVGEKLPSENDLCEIYNVARGTVRRSIKGLIAEGILESKKVKELLCPRQRAKLSYGILDL